jgi:hypothetical protein
LLIQESVLDWLNEHDVIWFITEPQLEREENLLRWRELKEAINPNFSDDFNGDYKIVVRNRQTQIVEIHECAIAVRQKISFIRRQPDRLKWYVGTSATAGKINLYTAQNVKILDPLSGDRETEITESVRGILETDKNRSPSSKLNQTDQRILEALKKTGMALSLHDLAALICTDPDPSETCLDSLRNSRTKLLKLELIIGREGKTRPGYGDGRPAQYVFLPECAEFFHEKGFQRHIVLAFFLRLELKKGRNFSGFNSKVPALTRGRGSHI